MASRTFEKTVSSNCDNPHYHYVLRLADNALIVAQRLGEWIGHGPQLEEELANANFALDYLGQARAFYSHAAELEGQGRDEDDLAFLRDSSDFENVLLVEQPNGDFAQTVVRQFFYDAFSYLQLQQLQASADEKVAAIATRGAKELEYHLRHVRQWVVRLGDGTEESHRRMQDAVNRLWCYSGELLAPDAIDSWASENGIGPDPATLKENWHQLISDAFAEATLSVPENGWMASGGKNGQHTEHHGYLLADLQFLQRAYPGATW